MSKQKDNPLCNPVSSSVTNEEQLQFILNLSDKIRPLSDAAEIHKVITQTTKEFFKADRCYYGEICGNKMIIRADTLNAKLKSTVGEYDWNKYRKSKFILDLGNPIVEDDVHLVGSAEEGLKEHFIQMGIIAYIIIPVIKDNNTVGALIITASCPRKWADLEVKLAIDIAERTWMAVERIRIENEKEELFSKLLEEKEKFKAIIESIDSDVWITDPLGNVTLIDSRYSKQIAIKAHDQPISEIFKQVAIFSTDGTLLKEEDVKPTRALQGETVREENIVIYKNSGLRMYKESISSPIINRDGSIIGAVTISTDITKRKEMELSLTEKEKLARELIKKLEETDKQRVAFLSTLSHELRNPLATIALGLDLMDYTEYNKEEQQKTREILKRQTKQLNRLVDDLLNMTRITQNKFELKLEEIELNHLLGQVIEDSYLFYNEQGIEVETNIEKERVFIEGDRARLTQLIENILYNASKFTPSGGKVTILLKKDKLANEAAISIRDTGLGISKELIKVIYEPYVQANTLGESASGLGIGLSIAKDIVEKHGGNIEALSEGEGMGTEFIIRLPALKLE